MSRALVIHGPGDLRIEERPDEMPGSGQVLIEIVRGGICGSDLHYHQHGGFGAVRLREPMILGHEVAGYIAALGADVAGLEVGQLVAVSPSRPCGHCRFCLAGMPNQCLNMRFYGSAMPFPHIQGAFRERLVADASQCVPADGLSAAHAAMAEPLSVALHAAGRAGALLGASVLVTGCGPIGLLCILAARRAGAARIVATDIAAFPLELARKVGADLALDAGAPGVLAQFEANKGTFDAHLECSGAEVALRSAIPAIRPRGVIVQIGLSGDMALPMQALTAREIEVRGSFRFHEEFAVAVAMMREGLIDVAPLLTHTRPLDEAAEAFALAADRRRAMKVQLAFRDG